MKRVFIIVFLKIILNTVVCSQNKQDYIWPLGLDWNGGIILDFNTNPLSSYPRDGVLDISRSVATICDNSGELLFYCNGWAVANRHHEVMPNGLGINDGRYFQEFWRGDWVNGSLLRQDMIILLDPADSLGYFIVHKTREYNPDQDEKPRFTMETLKYSYVDMKLDDGMGDVTEKDTTIFKGRLQADYLTAISMPNKKDWWIINPAQLANR